MDLTEDGSIAGHVTCTFADLCRVLGPPTRGSVWTLQLRLEGPMKCAAAVYDWRCRAQPPKGPYRWNIGAAPEEAAAVVDCLREMFSEKGIKVCRLA